MLRPFEYDCPGLSGPDSRQKIGRVTFGDFLNCPQRIVIPIFQRRYCWDECRVVGWWNDVIRGKRDHLGLHNSGNVVVKKVVENSTEVFVCIDGQQRLTTTSLLCAALRDAILKLPSRNLEEEEKERKKAMKMLEKAIYIDRKSVVAKDEILAGKDYGFSRLSPSYSDRGPYFSLIVEGRKFKSPDLPNTNSGSSDLESGSIQENTKRIFDKQIQIALSQCNGNKLEFLVECANSALFKMSMTLVDILSEVNMPQVFLWLQEKGLFGEGSLLYNPTPGIDFATSDLVRNLLMSAVANDTLENQEKLYTKLWLEPIEAKSQGPNDLSLKIGLFQRDEAKKIAVRHISKLEKKSKEFSKSMAKEKCSSLITYTEFYSLYEYRIVQKMMLPPNQVGKTDIAATADQTAIYSASMEILTDLANWFSKQS